VSETERVVCGEAGSRAQGTLVRVQLRVDLAEGAVREMRYRAFGCPYTLATCEWLARSLSGRSLGAVALGGGEWATAAGTPAQWCQALEIPPARLGRLLIIEDALLAALQAAARAATRGVDATAIAVAATADNR
jgi:NifU-like protein involved in Fe-S cluster formation